MNDTSNKCKTLNALDPETIGRHGLDDIFRCIFLEMKIVFLRVQYGSGGLAPIRRQVITEPMMIHLNDVQYMRRQATSDSSVFIYFATVLAGSRYISVRIWVVLYHIANLVDEKVMANGGTKDNFIVMISRHPVVPPITTKAVLWQFCGFF